MFALFAGLHTTEKRIEVLREVMEMNWIERKMFERKARKNADKYLNGVLEDMGFEVV